MRQQRPKHVTERDKQILELLAEGLNYREIAERVGVSATSVPSILQRIDQEGNGRVLEAREEADRKKGRLRDY